MTKIKFEPSWYAILQSLTKFMGVYLLFIASAEIYFGEYFHMRAEAWRSGISCRIAGTISIVSSEASVFFVALISVDRFVNIKHYNFRWKLRHKSSVLVAIVLWIMALVLGVVLSTLAGKDYNKFYDNSHVCIDLPSLNFEYTIRKNQKNGLKFVLMVRPVIGRNRFNPNMSADF